jgi:ketosteroid isomerase-like protein
MMSPEEFLRSYEAALATQSWPAVSALFHEDACVTFSNGLVFTGKQQVQGAFERNFALIEEEQYSISDLHWVKRTDSFAVCIYSYHWSGLIRGEPARGSGRGTCILTNQHGTWLLLAEHLGPGAK